MKHAMPEPPRRIEGVLLQLPNAPREKFAEHIELDPLSRIAIRGGCELQAGKVRQMRTGRIAMQDLQKEDLDRSDWVEQRLIPLHASVARRLGDGVFRKFLRPFLLELCNDLGDTSHGWRLLFAYETVFNFNT